MASLAYSGGGSYSSGDPGIDFLLGIPDTYTQASGGFIDTIAWENYIFAQDSWRATSDLTINYGLAWDVETPNNNSNSTAWASPASRSAARRRRSTPAVFPAFSSLATPDATKPVAPRRTTLTSDRGSASHGRPGRDRQPRRRDGRAQALDPRRLRALLQSRCAGRPVAEPG